MHINTYPNESVNASKNIGDLPEARASSANSVNSANITPNDICAIINILLFILFRNEIINKYDDKEIIAKYPKCPITFLINCCTDVLF